MLRVRRLRVERLGRTISSGGDSVMGVSRWRVAGEEATMISSESSMVADVGVPDLMLTSRCLLCR